MQQSEQLTAFYKAIWEWICSNYVGYEDIFYQSHGLCSNAFRYQCRVLKDRSYDIESELNKQFFDAFDGEETFPFNSSQRDYELENKSRYLNTKRLAWIKAHLPG